jgi:hypothetical protein
MVGPWILPHLSDRVLSVLEQEASVFVWSLRWWPHALGRGANPLFSDAVWAPTGINLAWVPTSPGPSLLAAPLTVSLGPVGPVVAFNLLSLAAPRSPRGPPSFCAVTWPGGSGPRWPEGSCSGSPRT